MISLRLSRLPLCAMWNTGDNLSHRCNTWKLNLKVGDIVDAQDSEEFTWWEAEIVSKYGVDDGRVPDDDDNGEDGVKGEHLCVINV